MNNIKDKILSDLSEYGMECYRDGKRQGKADERARVIDEVKTLIGARLIDNLNLTDATKYGNENAKQQGNSYSTVMKYEIADCVDDLLEDLEQLKEQKK